MPQDSDFERLIAAVIDHGFHLHTALGPGLLESAYEAFLAGSLREAGLSVRQQVSLPARYRNTTIENAFRIDLLVNDCLIVEIKSLERLAPVHSKQVLTYLRLTGQPVGLLMNFGAPLFKQGVVRIIDSRNPYGRPNDSSTA
jgi:iron complex transport system substrate-binding protein